jgi:arylsulfatase A-like enzyme
MEHQVCLYETLLRIPMVMRWPRRLPANRRSHAPVQIVDVAPTILDAIGLGGDGRSAMEGRTLLSSDPPSDRRIYAEYMRPREQREIFHKLRPNFDFTPFDRRLASIQKGSWKMILSGRGEIELYDLAKDPDERAEVSAANPKIVEELRGELTSWQAKAKSAAPAAVPTPALDEETIRELRSLGYVQ